MHANFVEWDYNLVPGDVKINQPYSIKALGNITNIFLSTNAIMCHNIKKTKVL
jgi:hypothetical protein